MSELSREGVEQSIKFYSETEVTPDEEYSLRLAQALLAAWDRITELEARIEALQSIIDVYTETEGVMRIRAEQAEAKLDSARRDNKCAGERIRELEAKLAEVEEDLAGAVRILQCQTMIISNRGGE